MQHPPAFTARTLRQNASIRKTRKQVRKSLRFLSNQAPKGKR